MDVIEKWGGFNLARMLEVGVDAETSGANEAIIGTYNDIDER